MSYWWSADHLVVLVKLAISFLFAAAFHDLLASLLIHEIDVALVAVPASVVVVVILENNLVIVVEEAPVPVAAVGSASSMPAAFELSKLLVLVDNRGTGSIRRDHHRPPVARGSNNPQIRHHAAPWRSCASRLSGCGEHRGRCTEPLVSNSWEEHELAAIRVLGPR